MAMFALQTVTVLIESVKIHTEKSVLRGSPAILIAFQAIDVWQAHSSAVLRIFSLQILNSLLGSPY